MNIHIKTKNLELKDEIKSYIDEKIGHLEKFTAEHKSDREILAEVEVGKENNHHNHGEDLYRAEINLSIDKDMLRAVSQKPEILEAIDDAKEQMQEQINSHRSKKKDFIRRGAKKAKDMMRFGRN